MTIRNLSALVLLGAVAAAGQAVAPAEAPAGITVIKYSWRNATRPAALDRPTTSASEQSLENPLPGVIAAPDRGPTPNRPHGTTPSRQAAESARVQASRRTATAEPIAAEAPSDMWRRVGGYAYEVRIRNEAEGTIEAVAWDYVFVEPGAGRELARHRFHTFRRAKPGKTVTLAGSSAAPPTRIVSAAGQSGEGKRKLFEERVVIRCVIYADGSARWRDSGAESDCERLRAHAQTRTGKKP